MMNRGCSIRTNLRAAALAGLLVVAAASSPAQQSGGGGSNPFDGEWSLVWDLSTAPGGVTLALPSETISPYNAAHHAAKEQFHVKEDGSIKWAQSDAGLTYHNGVSSSGQFWGDRKIHLRATGKAQAPRAATGELRAEDRRLTLDLTTIGGNGISSGTSTGGIQTATIVANIDDREMVMYPGAIRAPNLPWTRKWQDLKPTRVTKEELAPDVIRETITYEVTRETRIPKEVNGLFTPPMTERIEIKHVHYPRLVPRG